MKLQYVEAIIAIAESGSIRGAAERIGKTQPAISGMLRQMEEELKVSLFHRTSKGVTPTEVGKLVLRRARTVSREITRLTDEIAQFQGENTGTVRVCVSPLGAIRILPNALAAFRRSFPLVTVQATSGLYPRALKELREGTTDLLIGPEADPAHMHDLSAHPLIDTKVIIVTRSGSEFGRATSLRELQSANWIMLGQPDGPGDVIDKLFRENGIEPPEPRITSESYFGAIAMAIQLGAVCTFPEKLLDQMNFRQNIDIIPVREQLPVHKISLISRDETTLTPAARELAKSIIRRATTLEERSRLAAE